MSSIATPLLEARDTYADGLNEVTLGLPTEGEVPMGNTGLFSKIDLVEETLLISHFGGAGRTGCVVRKADRSMRK